MRSRPACVTLLLCLLSAEGAIGQQTRMSSDTGKGAADSATVTKTRAARRWRMVHANEAQTPFTTFRIGAAILPEIAGYNQDNPNRGQVGLITGEIPSPVDLREPGGESREAEETAVVSRAGDRLTTRPRSSSSPPGTLFTAGKIRDSRFIVSGRLMTKRKITWQTGLMYDWATNKWLIRQTGFVISAPEIYSNFWIGRTKEGPSLNRVMVGYDGWTMERFTFSDAAIPLLADGIRWQGYIPKAHLIWNLGGFIDYLSEGESFNYFTNQVAGRIGFLWMDSDSAGSLLHLAVGFHDGIPNEGSLRLKSKPEASGAPNFIDTGKFPATAAQLVGLEAYYRPGSWLFGSEYYLERARSPQTGNPVFSGGDLSVLWIITGETRRYLAPGSTFAEVVPAKSVYERGGPGAWEVGLRFSNIDLDAGTLQGGKFWRFTPVANWYLSENVRLEMEYGYSSLVRFGLRGVTKFFQSRIQLQL